MYAIVEIAGKQYKVQEGDIVFVDRLEVEEGSEVTFDQVLFVNKDGKVTIGDNTVKGAKVVASVVGHGKAKKVLVYKYKAKKNERKTIGHRQPYTKLQITKVSVAAPRAKKEEAEEVKEVKETKTTAKTTTKNTKTTKTKAKAE